MTDYRAHDERIRQAWAALCGARAVANRTPTAETLRIEQMCERTVNDLLDTRNRMRAAEEMVTA